jgi:hypothetical protein
MSGAVSGTPDGGAYAPAWRALPLAVEPSLAKRRSNGGLRVGQTRLLNEREKRFVDEFLGPQGGNGTRSAIAAGYSRAGARVQASRLLTNANVQHAIVSRVKDREQAAIASADERDRILSAIARNPSVEARDRIRAIAELNKCSGRHSVQHQHSGGLTLEEAIAASRRPVSTQQGSENPATDHNVTNSTTAAPAPYDSSRQPTGPRARPTNRIRRPAA